MKRAIIAVVAGLVTFTGIYGLAASLNLSTSSLGAGTATVAACQAATINVTYTPSYAATIPGYAAGTVTANNLQATCYSMPYRITLYGAAGASLGEVTGTTPRGRQHLHRELRHRQCRRRDGRGPGHQRLTTPRPTLDSPRLR